MNARTYRRQLTRGTRVQRYITRARRKRLPLRPPTPHSTPHTPFHLLYRNNRRRAWEQWRLIYNAWKARNPIPHASGISRAFHPAAQFNPGAGSNHCPYL